MLSSQLKKRVQNNPERIKSTPTRVEFEEAILLESVANNLRDRLLFRFLRSMPSVSATLMLGTENIDFSSGKVVVQSTKPKIKLLCSECGAKLIKRFAYCPQCGLKVETVEKELEPGRTWEICLDGETLIMLRKYITGGGPVTRNGKAFLFNIGRTRVWQIVRENAQRAGLSKLVDKKTGNEINLSPIRLRKPPDNNTTKR